MHQQALGFQGCLTSMVSMVKELIRNCPRTSTIMSGGVTRMTEQLADKKCVPCRGGVPPLKGKDLEALHKVVPKWTVVDEHHITRSFSFPDFAQALAFVNRVGALAEEQGHHPDILLAWGKAEITLWTHKVNGLTESDFIMAAKIDRLHG
jgi:4a-hydroxytetrahydrobiopterin dehydratase